MKSKVRKINWVGLMVDDFDEALKFYTNVLGMKIDNLYEERQVAQFYLESGQLFEIFGPKNKERKGKYKFFNAFAILCKLSTETFCSPRSIEPIQVRCRCERNPSSFCGNSWLFLIDLILFLTFFLAVVTCLMLPGRVAK